MSENVGRERDRGIAPLPIFRRRRFRAEVAGFFAMLGGIEFLSFEVKSLLQGGARVAAVSALEARMIATARVIRDVEVPLFTFGPDGLVAAFRHLSDTRQSAAAQG